MRPCQHSGLAGVGDGDRFDAGYTANGTLCCTFFGIATDMTGERHHATVRGHTDMSSIDAGLPNEFVEYGLL